MATRQMPTPTVSGGRAFREKVKPSDKRGRCRLQEWPEIVIGTVVKKTAKHQVVKVIRHMAPGTIERAEELLALPAREASNPIRCLLSASMGRCESVSPV